MRNTVIIVSIAIILIVGGIFFYLGKSGAISADVESAECKYYTFSDRKVYTQNQTVSFSVKNDKYSKCILKIRNDIGPWEIVDSNNRIVYKKDSDGPILNLKPGQRQDWQWSGTSSTGSAVTAGAYKIKFTSLNKDVLFTISASAY